MPLAGNINDPFTPQEWDEHCASVTCEMAPHAEKFSTPISISMDHDRRGKHVGTGSYHNLLGTEVLLSCEHVLKYRAKNRMAHKLRGFDRYILIDGARAGAGWPIDVEVAPIAAWDSVEHGSEALPLSRWDFAHDPDPFELMFVHGYASENAQFLVDELRTGGTAYVARQAKLPGHEEVDQRFHFAIEYRRDAAVQAFGRRGLPDPHSMSGSLVWNTKFVECMRENKSWSPAEAVVTGLLRSWPTEDRIVATRIEYVRSFLLSVFDEWNAS